MNVLVTGASGFIGRVLCSTLLAKGHLIRAAIRSEDSVPLAKELGVVAVGEVGAQTDWSAALVGVDCVIHCAARVHVMQETEADAMVAYRSVNVDGSSALAEQAVAAGVRRLVFLSSIGVNGVHTNGRRPFRFTDAPQPIDDYAISKWEAEEALKAVAANTSLELVVVRPPLVYGPGCKGNLLRLLRLVHSGIPLPLGAAQNQRSFIGLNNLVDLLICCIDHPAAAGWTFLASDGEDFAIPQLIRFMAEGMNRSSRLLRMPLPLLQAGGSLLGKRRDIDRLFYSLQVNSEDTRAQLNWNPPVPVEEGVREMARWYAEWQASMT